ncbi:MAG: 30S ribosomal protein S1 [Candidatus Harrisonbacteria bacterium CG10_big_fil_rev_8_21_14_0_10_42_17]|uniref:30S ribosomal protein S1 n=1 Tax=Candidatus Harrisonbacteria bacterium CG10_big_fil_rev_8_21_14_0_10_42_17 TaxID=1974584 RepID=A0A2M6WIS5_9BACT|nr:MAG: 30S ribosomal protein S1 [Candidatus Harrisonbacteria bacterium CG10_big_fil_rev_8_21_14_0_10_42_17]
MTVTKKSNPQIAQLLKSENGFSPIARTGELAEGTLIEKAPKAAYFDLGALGTGVVYGAEYINASQVIKGLQLGAHISAKIIEPENDDGYVELSLSEAGRQRAWQEVKDLKEAGEVITVTINNSNAGGLLADIHDIKAFLPVSQLTSDHYPRVDDGDREKIADELKKFVGQEMQVKIIDFKPHASKLIISERETNEENAKELLEGYEVGQVIDGIVSGVADFGAFLKFADNPNIEGLVHISELDHKLIENPKEIVSINDAVKAKIIEIKDGRVSLSLKALKDDPWKEVAEKYKEGQVIKGTISRFNPFGAFVALDSDIQGLIHVSEFGSVDEMKQQLEVGSEYDFNIELMKPDEKRIILKLNK